MFQAAIDSLNNILAAYPWVGPLANILPLSALIDFIDVPLKLHVLQLVGAVPLWSWVITPSGSRLLLAKQDKLSTRNCYQDRFGKTAALEALDGRYGERYFISSPETLRLLVNAHPITEVGNDHVNMTGDDDDLRIQKLDVIHISRRDPAITSTPPRLRWRQVFFEDFYHASPLYIATTLTGWMLLVAMMVMSVLFQTWIALAFFILIPVTGFSVVCLYGSQPRRLLVEKRSDFVRLVVVTEHMDSADWLVLYGESTLVNSLLNRPLEPNGPRLSPTLSNIFRFLLQLFILGQWALALGAAATSNWNSYFISFWIAISILSHVYLLTPERSAKAWSDVQANLKIERFGTTVSTRRTLINTIVALNPDTFPFDPKVDGPDMAAFYSEGMKWIDPILTRSNNRSLWEEATRTAMAEARPQLAGGDLSQPKFRGPPEDLMSNSWNNEYAEKGRCYWKRFIPKGIYVAAKIRKAAGLPKRKVVGLKGLGTP